jgi:spermidine/putrescine transport system substrate-binding protein
METDSKSEVRGPARLRCLGWEGYADGSLASAFVSATGFSVSGENHLSDDAASRKVLDERGSWDVININTPFVRDVLYPAGAVRSLPSRFADRVNNLIQPFNRFKTAVLGPNDELIGLPQRFGPFNLVINQRRLSVSLARDQGFRLALDPGLKGRFGILDYEDFNVMHIAIAAGVNPFERLDEVAVSTFSEAATIIMRSARLATGDHHRMNAALISGEIDFYISGGTYTASSARLADHLEVRAVTPIGGPIDEKGAVAFVEVNALLGDGAAPPYVGEAFLDFISSAEGAKAASLAAGACNPVVQMSEPAIYNLFTRQELGAMQWEDLEEDLSCCADYEIIPDYAMLLRVLQSSSRRSEDFPIT